MSELLEYKCPCCGGDLEFNSQLQKMKCPYCDTVFEMDTLKEYDEALKSDADSDMEWETSAGGSWRPGETDGMAVYICDSCGGEIISDATTAASQCPFCGNPVVMKGNFSGDLRPDYVIPFQRTKEDAKAAFLHHLKGKRLVPKVFLEQNHIDEIKGVYVPFWLFDADVSANIRYRATRMRAWSDSNYNYVETSHYSLLRTGGLGFEHVPVDGSSVMADDLMESIEPFDFSQAVDFQTAYMAGFFADRYDVDAQQSITRANERIQKSTERMFASTVSGYQTAVPEHSAIHLSKSSAKYALYPVWLLSTRWQDKTYIFAMNGQTGKFVGDLPLDKGAYWRWLLGLWGICSAGLFLLLLLAWLLGI